MNKSLENAQTGLQNFAASLVHHKRNFLIHVSYGGVTQLIILANNFCTKSNTNTKTTVKISTVVNFIGTIKH